jgi:hypothetical protein
MAWQLVAAGYNHIFFYSPAADMGKSGFCYDENTAIPMPHMQTNLRQS